MTGLLQLAAAWTAVATIAGLALATAIRHNTARPRTARKEN